MPDLSYEESWINIYSQRIAVSGQPTPSNRLQPLIFPLSFISPHLKIFAHSSALEKGYSYAGSLSLYIGDPEQEVQTWVASRRILLGSWRLCEFPQILTITVSHLSFRAPYWLPDIAIEAWQYQEI